MHLNSDSSLVIEEFKMHTRDIQALIGDTISGIFAPGYNQQSHYIRLGDTIGLNDYTDIIEHFYSVVFVACTGTYQIGIGTGVMGDTKDSIETYCHDEETFWMKDITRCGYHDPHGHDGNMHFLSSIKTYFHAGGDSFTIASDIDNNWTGQVQRPAVDAQVYTGWTYDFMWHTLGRYCSIINPKNWLESSACFISMPIMVKYSKRNMIILGINQQIRSSFIGCFFIVKWIFKTNTPIIGKFLKSKLVIFFLFR